MHIIFTLEEIHEVNDFTNLPDISHYKEQNDHNEVDNSVVTRNTTLGVEKQVYNSNQKMTNALDSLKLKKDISKNFRHKIIIEKHHFGTS